MIVISPPDRKTFKYFLYILALVSVCFTHVRRRFDAALTAFYKKNSCREQLLCTGLWRE